MRRLRPISRGKLTVVYLAALWVRRCRPHLFAPTSFAQLAHLIPTPLTWAGLCDYKGASYPRWAGTIARCLAAQVKDVTTFYKLYVRPTLESLCPPQQPAKAAVPSRPLSALCPDVDLDNSVSTDFEDLSALMADTTELLAQDVGLWADVGLLGWAAAGVCVTALGLAVRRLRK